MLFQFHSNWKIRGKTLVCNSPTLWREVGWGEIQFTIRYLSPTRILLEKSLGNWISIQNSCCSIHPEPNEQSLLFPITKWYFSGSNEVVTFYVIINRVFCCRIFLVINCWEAWFTKWQAGWNGRNWVILNTFDNCIPTNLNLILLLLQVPSQEF